MLDAASRPWLSTSTAICPSSADERALARVPVPVGGGKDSAVALEIVRASGPAERALFSLGDAPPIARTAAGRGPGPA